MRLNLDPIEALTRGAILQQLLAELVSAAGTGVVPTVLLFSEYPDFTDTRAVPHGMRIRMGDMLIGQVSRLDNGEIAWVWGTMVPKDVQDAFKSGFDAAHKEALRRESKS